MRNGDGRWRRFGGNLGLAMGIDRKEAGSCGGEEPKDARREERGLGDPFVGDGGSARTYTPMWRSLDL